MHQGVRFSWSVPDISVLQTFVERGGGVEWRQAWQWRGMGKGGINGRSCERDDGEHINMETVTNGYHVLHDLTLRVCSLLFIST